MVEMTLEEAEYIARNRLPDEPREDEWRPSRPSPEPRRERTLDTAPAPDPVDWSAVIGMALKASRAEQAEVIGSAMGEYGNQLADELLAEVRQLIEAAVEGLRAEFTRQIEELRSDFTAQATDLFESVALISTEGQRLRAQLEQAIAKKTRTGAKAPRNGSDALPLADASLAPKGFNGDGRQ
jgi:hypothetical protein